MKKNLSLLLLVLFCSCASAGRWREISPPFKKQTWRICTEEFDGDKKALKGYCYISKECKNRFLIKDKCRPFPKFIPFTDKAGVLKMSSKVLVNP